MVVINGSHPLPLQRRDAIFKCTGNQELVQVMIEQESLFISDSMKVDDKDVIKIIFSFLFSSLFLLFKGL